MALVSPQQLNTEQLALLRLLRTDGIGPVAVKKLLAKHGSAVRALNTVDNAPAATSLQPEFDTLTKRGGGYIFAEHYPQTLLQLHDCPPVLSALGNIDLLHKPQVAIVGSRNASAMNMRFTRDLAARLAAAGMVVTSGLARGIDTAAHNGALEGGTTIGVLGGGLDFIYPPENEALYKRIAENGLLLAETACGTAVTNASFPRRNRIIAALAQGTVVIEAAKRSGSLITARLALELGREVFAIPGHPTDPRAEGPNQLIRDGAVLTTCLDDILSTLHGSLLTAPKQESLFADDDTPPTSLDDTLKNLLSAQPTAVDELVRQSGYSAAAVHALLAEWELLGEVERLPGNRVARL